MKMTLCIFRLMALAGMAALFGLGQASAATGKGGIDYGNNATVGKFVELNGNRFYYEEYGNGTPVLFIHGNGSSIADFKNQIGVFARHHRVIAMDSRAQGKSAVGTEKLTYELMAEDSNAFLEKLKLDHIDVLGWSDGGIIGLLLTIHHPDKVKMLAVLGANLEPEAAYSWATEGIVKVRARINEALAQGKDAKPLQLQLQLLDLLGEQPHIPLTALNQIRIPTLVMAGDRDVIKDEHTLAMFHAIQKSQLAIFPGATHVIPVQDPARFNQTVLHFFDTPFAMPDTKDLGWFD